MSGRFGRYARTIVGDFERPAAGFQRYAASGTVADALCGVLDGVVDDASYQNRVYGDRCVIIVCCFESSG